MSVNYEPVKMSVEALDDLQDTERGMGKVLVAVEPTTSQSAYARLTGPELRQLQETEKRLGCIVLAFDNT